jgi:hypothetical protein
MFMRSIVQMVEFGHKYQSKNFTFSNTPYLIMSILKVK